MKEEDQQEAIWELVYTEHSHLTQLAVVINVRTLLAIISDYIILY